MVAAALQASGSEARDSDIELGRIGRVDPDVRRDDYQALRTTDALKVDSLDDSSKDENSHTDLELELSQTSAAATSNHGLLPHRSSGRVDVFIMSTRLDRVSHEADEAVNRIAQQPGSVASMVRETPGTLMSTLGGLYSAVADVALFPLRTIGVVGISSAEETAAGAELMMESEDVVRRRR